MSTLLPPPDKKGNPRKETPSRCSYFHCTFVVTTIQVGAVQAKNAKNILIKNVFDASLGASEWSVPITMTPPLLSAPESDYRKDRGWRPPRPLFTFFFLAPHL